MRLKECPICQKKFLKQGLLNHIINTAKGETYRHTQMYFDQMKNKPCSRNKPCGRSPLVFLRQIPHLAFIRRNLKTKKYLYV